MFGLGKYGNGVGLHRILRFCAEENVDLAAMSGRSIVVTGSNGKGSTARFACASLQSVYERVGCFTSPHLFEVYERVEISGSRISPALFEVYKARVLAFNQRIEDEGDFIGEFELLFLVALLWFAEENVDCAVWEAGIGGRYDPVRALQASLTALTSVELEHTELLGATKELIAYDKLDACRCGGQMVISPAVDAALYDRLEAFAEVSGRRLVFASDVGKVTNVVRTKASTAYDVSLPDCPAATVKLSLPGAHQVDNSLTALVLAKKFIEWQGKRFSLDRCVSALETVTWPGRMEKIRDVPEVWIDVGHSPDAVRTVSDEFLGMFPREEILVVCGISANKRVDDIIKIIEKRFSNVMLTKAYKNGCEVDELYSRFTDKKIIKARTRTIEEAVKISIAFAIENSLKIVVLGGLFLSIEYACTLRGGNPQALNFF